MKKAICSVISFVIIAAIMFVAPPFSLTAYAQETGTCGDDLTWVIDDSGTLTISGTGEMKNTLSGFDYPWFFADADIIALSLPKGLTRFERDLFYSDTLESVSVEEGNAEYMSIDGVLFSSDGKELVYFPEGRSGSYTVPDGVEVIRSMAFYHCNNLTELILPDSLTTLSDRAVAMCRSLERVNIPSDVRTVGSDVFYCCDSLENAYIPSGIGSIGSGMYSFCPSLRSVTIENGIKEIGASAFSSCDALTGAVIPDSVEIIGEGAFSYCRNLENLTLPEKLRLVGASAFLDCYSLSEVYIPAGVTDIGVSAFCGCTSLKNITVSPENSSFYDLDGVLFNADGSELMCFPAGRTGAYTVPGGTRVIFERAFNRSGLNEIILPEGLESISRNSFACCRSLTGIVIPDGISSIPAGAFYCCDSLKSVTLPNTVTRIDNEAFSIETVLPDVFYHGTPGEWAAVRIGDENSITDKTNIHFIYDEVNVVRLAGATRQETSALISSETFDSAENAVIASGTNYADALAGVPLADAMDAPILLVNPQTGLDGSVSAELERLGVKNVTILGGTAAVPESVAGALRSFGYSVSRIAGENRYDTAVEIAKKLCGIAGVPEEVFFVYADNYPDALAVSASAAIKKAPVLYVSGKGGIYSGESFISDMKDSLKKAYIIGGTAVISPDAEGVIGRCAPVERIAGNDRYLTCAEVNRRFADVLTGSSICIATGTNSPDALAGGVLAARTESPTLLVSSVLPECHAPYIESRAFDRIYVLGGANAVSEEVVNAAADAVNAGGPDGGTNA